MLCSNEDAALTSSSLHVSQFVSIYLADRTYGEEGAPTQAITIAKELRASGVFINHRFYHGNFKLDKTLLTNGSYWLKVDETYSPNVSVSVGLAYQLLLEGVKR